MLAKKRCFKCNIVKSLDEFYRHPGMGDGRLNKCIECTRSDVRRNYSSKREQYRLYDQERQQRPERKQLKLVYQTNHRKLNPEKYKARNALNNAIRDGKIQRQPCEVCGTTSRVEGHHADYSKPLEVHWLCFTHHREHGHGQKAA